MPIRFLQHANLGDVKREMSRMLQEGITNTQVRFLAEEITLANPDAIGAIYDFVKQTFPYQKDPFGIELFVAPKRVITDYRSGRIRHLDCDDMALLNAALLGSLGYEARILLVDLGNSGELNHAFAQVKTGLGWVAVDTASRFPLGWVREYSLSYPI